MNLRTHKIVVCIALALVLCTGAALLAQAFFQAFNQNASGTVTVTPPEKVDGSTVYVKVASEADLIKATKDDIYNSPEDISEAAKRVIILLTADITLTQDLLITRDCHIDLGSKTLDTNGHTMTVYHTYTGAYVIANGTLKGAINVNTPNAAVLIDENSVNKTELTANVTAASAEAVRNAALSMVAAHLTNVLDDHGIYGMLTAGCTLPDFRSLYGCSHASGCCFLAEDPDLPYWFFGYKDLKFAYETTSADGVESLKATVTYGGTSSSQTFMIHKVTTANEQSKAAAAIVLKELEPFYKADEKKYNFSTPVLLPSKVALGHTTSVSMTYGTTAGTLSDKNGAKLYSPSETGGNLVVNSTTVNTSGSISSITETDYTKANRVVKELFGSSIVIQKSIDATTQAVSYTEQSLAYNPADFPASYDIDGISFSLVNNDQYHDYEIVNGVLRVAKNPDGSYSGAPEEHSIVTIFLQATVLMHKDTDNEISISISVPITCKDVQDPGGQVDQFLPYYYYFNRMFTEVTSGNYTYTSFRMPMSYASGKPEIEFWLVNVDENGTYTYTDATTADLAYLKVTADDDTNEWVFTIYPEEIGLDDREISFAYNYRFNTAADVWTLFSEGDGADGKYSTLTIPGVVNRTEDCPDPVLYEKLFKIYHREAYVQDKETQEWKWVYNLPVEDADGNLVGGDYILVSRLNQAIGQDQLDFENNTTITNFKGIELLNGAIGINLKNSGITVADLTLIAGMTNLQYLNLAENELTDGTGGFGATTDIIAPLATSLAKLQVLHLENNNIYDFSSLADFQSLTEVHVYGNSPTYTALTGILGSFLNPLFTEIVQSLYGSEGSTNIATFSALYARGVDVYNESADTPFAPSQETANKYAALTNLEYQDKVIGNTDISLMFGDLSTSPEAYGIAKKGPIRFPTYEGETRIAANDIDPFENKISFRLPYAYDQNGNIILDDQGNPTYVSGSQADHFYLVYTDFETANVTAGGLGGIFNQTETVAFSYDIEFKFPITRVDENGTPIN